MIQISNLTTSVYQVRQKYLQNLGTNLHTNRRISTRYSDPYVKNLYGSISSPSGTYILRTKFNISRHAHEKYRKSSKLPFRSLGASK